MLTVSGVAVLFLIQAEELQRFGGLLFIEYGLMEHAAIMPEQLHVIKKQVVYFLYDFSEPHNVVFCVCNKPSNQVTCDVSKMCGSDRRGL